MQQAGEEDWATEYLALTLAVGVVDSVEEAIEHIARYGSGHSEAIVTRDTGAARAFQLGVDAACVYVNASTRFTDGGEFGMGAEIGNSTQKLHARGPIGLRELCTFKYLVEGDGHVRALEAADCPGLSRARSRRSDRASSAGRSTRRTSGTSRWRATRARSWALERVLLMPAHIAPHKPVAARTPARSIVWQMCRARGRARSPV